MLRKLWILCKPWPVAAALALASIAASAPAHAAMIYWNLFNAEGENAASAVYVTYATLGDMLHDTNRTGSGAPDGFGAAINVIGSGAFVMAMGPVKVPEPASSILFGIGLVGVGFAQRRRRRSRPSPRHCAA